MKDKAKHLILITLITVAALATIFMCVKTSTVVNQAATKIGMQDESIQADGEKLWTQYFKNKTVEDGPLKQADTALLNIETTKEGLAASGEIVLSTQDAENNTITVVVPLLTGKYQVKYKQNGSFLVLNNKVGIQLHPYDANNVNGVSGFTDGSQKTILVMSRNIENKATLTAIALCENEAERDEFDNLLHDIFTNVKIGGNQKYIFDKMNICNDWTNDVLINDEVLRFTAADDKEIYVCPFDKSLMSASMTSEVKLAESATVLYDPEIKDETTGFTPYIYPSESGSYFKILARAADDVKSFCEA